MMLNKKQIVKCSQCASELERRPLNPNTGLPIRHFFCGHSCKAIWQRAQKPYDREWLYQRYIVEGMSANDIAAMVGRNSKRVWEWLTDYGIPTRPRGSDERQQFKKGHPGTFTGRQHTAETRAILSAQKKESGLYPKQADGRPYWAGKTGTDHPSWKGGATPERQAFYGTPEWKRAERAAYVNAGGKCQRCGAGAKAGLHVHHVIPFAFKRVRASVNNLRVLCKACHRFVHSKANVDREFLPPWGIMYLREGATVRPIKINYGPTRSFPLPSWLRSVDRQSDLFAAAGD